MNPSQIRAVVLDFGGVLLHLGDLRPHQALAQELGIPLEVLHREVFDGPLSVAAQRGEISPEELWQRLAEQWGWPRERGEELAARFWEGVRIDTALVDFMRGLRPRYRTALLSNAWSDLRALLHRLGVADAFDVMVISAEERLMKPEPEIYQVLLERLNLPPEATVFVDDRPENIAAAQALGMHGIVYRSREQVLDDLRKLGVQP